MATLTPTTTPAPVRTGNRFGRMMRGLARGVGVTVAVIAGLSLAGAGYEAIASRGDARAYPPPGKMVDVGGYKLHIQCLGTGSPTVVLDAGLGCTSLDWSLVQAEIGQTTRVCAYDRAGMGWSESGPEPRTPEQNARELHTLLANAGLEGPYVLVDTPWPVRTCACLRYCTPSRWPGWCWWTRAANMWTRAPRLRMRKLSFGTIWTV